MLFHTPDKSQKTLVSCWKRAERFGRAGSVMGHPLSASWSNAKMMLDAEDVDATKPQRIEEMAYNLVILDWFAGKVDAFLKSHLLEGDATLAAILHEWKSRIFFTPFVTS